MSPSTTALLTLLLSTSSLAQTTTTTVYPETTYTTLGYTLTQVVPPSSASQYTLATPPICPEGYGTLEGNICLAPNTGYSVQPSTTEAPILVTLTEPVPTFGGPSTTVTTEGHTVTDLTMSTATRLETVTDSQLYCPPPLSAYGQACVTAGTNPFSTTATSATMSFNSTVTVTYTPPTTTSIRTASVATNTRGTTNPFGISLGGPATTITSGGSTITRYSASGGVLNSLTSTAAATATVAPYKGDAAGRVGGAVGGVAAVGAAALWLL